MNKTLIIGIVVAIAIITISAIVIVLIKNKGNYEIVTDEEELDLKKSKEKKDYKKVISKIGVKEKVTKNTDLSKRNSEDIIYYNEYQMSMVEKVKYSLMAMAVIFIAGYIFYTNWICSLLLSFTGLFYPKIKRKQIIKIRKAKLLTQFKEALYAISSSLTAGKAVPMAFIDAHNDLELIYGSDKEIYILKELKLINRKIAMNETVDSALNDLAKRSELEDIKTFADIFTVCNKTGGNLKRVVENSSKIIGDKIEIKQDINTLISAKKFEANILTAIPFGIVVFMRYTAPEFLEPLNSMAGRMIATVSLVLIAVATLLASKITNIEV